MMFNVSMRNVEIKAKIKNRKDLIAKAKVLSESEGTIISQTDTFYNVQQGRLKLRRFENGSAELIYYERPDKEGPKMSSYEKCLIDSGEVDALNNVLSRALGSTGDVKKLRQLFLVDQTRIHVDSVENLGDFMELEVGLMPEQTAADGESVAHSLMEKLGVDRNDLLAGAYHDMLKNVKYFKQALTYIVYKPVYSVFNFYRIQIFPTRYIQGYFIFW